MISEGKTKQKRFILIDGLRGIAAIWVVFFHLYTGTLHVSLSPITPVPLNFLFVNGYLGVQIFFVLSGFVIAYSLRNVTANLKFITNFTIRRLIRLNPAYYVVIALAFFNNYLPNLLLKSDNPVPSIAQVISNMFYLQNILGYGDIVPVFWTLCIEIQFYFVFVFFLVVSEKVLVWLAKNKSLQINLISDSDPKRRILLILITPLYIISLGLVIGKISFGKSFFLEYWYMFDMVALVYWTLEGSIKKQLFYIYFIVMLISTIFVWKPEPLVATLVASIIYLAGCYGGLYRWLGGSFFQYLGRISYSLYLIHWIVGYRFLNLSNHFAGQLQSVILFLLSLLFCIAAAHLLYLWVEKPSLSVTKKLKEG